MNKLVWVEDDSGDITLIDKEGVLRCPHPDELAKYATKKEIAEARHRYEASQMPLPVYDPAADMYHWGDPEDLWDAEDIADDIRKLWPLMNADQLLESSRLMAQLGITD